MGNHKKNMFTKKTNFLLKRKENEMTMPLPSISFFFRFSYSCVCVECFHCYHASVDFSQWLVYTSFMLARSLCVMYEHSFRISRHCYNDYWTYFMILLLITW